MVVGGVAVVLQGHARLTVDLDLVVDLEPEQAAAAIEVLTAMGLQPRAPVRPGLFADPEERNRWIEEKGMEVFSLVDFENPLRTVDLFVRHPIPFDELWQRAERLSAGGIEVPVASIPDLIRLKRISGRAQDLADIEELEELQKLRGDIE